jgi:hypothetical protein
MHKNRSGMMIAELSYSFLPPKELLDFCYSLLTFEIEPIVVDGESCKRYTVSDDTVRFALKRYNYYNYFSRSGAQSSIGGRADMKFWIFFRKFERY